MNEERLAEIENIVITDIKSYNCVTNYKDVLDLIQALRDEKQKVAELRKWISVTDQLPELGEEVIVFVPQGRRTVTALCRLIRYEGDKEFYWDNSRGTGNWHLPESITHWMPLPLPSKGV